MSSYEVPGNETGDDKPPMSCTTQTSVEYIRTMSQNLRYLDDGLTHAIDQLTTFNSETMSDLSLKYELIRNNESRVISFFARQLMLLQMQKSTSQNGGFHSEYSKLNRFLSVLNFNKKSIEYIVQRITFDDLLNGKATAREKLLYDAETTEIERKDFRNALNALKDCIDHFSRGDTNDNGRFFWHKETPPPTTITPYTVRQHRLSDTVLSTPLNTDSIRATYVTSSLSTEFGTVINSSNNNNYQSTITSLPHTRRTTHTPPPSRSTHLCVTGQGKNEHPRKKNPIDLSIFTNANSTRSMDLQLPDGSSTSRRSSNGSDTDSRIPSGAATPKSPTLRSPTFSGSPIGSAHNSDTENDPKTPDTPIHNTTHSSILTHRMAHTILHKWSSLMKLSTCNVCSRKILFLGTKCNICKFDRTRVFKFSFCDVCKRQVFRGKACLHCKYKCHKECVQNAPPNCGFSDIKLRKVIDDANNAILFANFSPVTRKHNYTASDSTSPTPSTPMSAPDSPAPHSSIPGYLFNSSIPNGNPSIRVSESIYCTQNDPESWVVIETNTKTTSELPDSQSDSDANSTNQTDTGSDLTVSMSNKLARKLSQSEPVHENREAFKAKLSMSFDDENGPQTPKDWVIVFNDIKIIEEVRRSSGSLMKAHWHGDLAVRMIKPNPKLDEIEFRNKLINQVFRLRKVRHEHLNLYTGVCTESPNFAIASSWIRGLTLFEMIHIRNDSISLNLAVQYAAQIANAMSYLHEKSINHMSLRTTNIFVQNNRIVLTDYGLVPFSKCYRFTEQPAIIAPRGWLSYLAPEIIRKLDPRDEQTLLQHTPQTDVYAFGTVWYEILFREFPFAKQPVEYIIWRAGNSLKQPLSSVHISKNAKDIINQCWSFVPDDRPDFATLSKSLTKMPGRRALVRSPSTPLQYHGNPMANQRFN